MPGRHPHTLLTRYPDYWAQIVALVDSNERFRTMCEDYEEAVLAAGRWQQSDQKHTSSREQEYLDLAGQLADEIVEFFRSNTPPSITTDRLDPPRSPPLRDRHGVRKVRDSLNAKHSENE